MYRAGVVLLLQLMILSPGATISGFFIQFDVGPRPEKSCENLPKTVSDVPTVIIFLLFPGVPMV